MISRARRAYAALGAGGGVRPSRVRGPDSGGEREVRAFVGVVVAVEGGIGVAVAGVGRRGDMVGGAGTSNQRKGVRSRDYDESARISCIHNCNVEV